MATQTPLPHASSSPCPTGTSYPVPSLPATVQWFGATSATMFPWPIIVVALLVVFIVDGRLRRRVSRVLRSLNIKSIKFASAEIELDDAKQEVQAAAADVAAVLTSYSKQLDAVISQAVDDIGLRELVERYVTDVVSTSIAHYPPKGFRCTIHISDPLLTGFLYQLIDYYPSGEGSGRRFSIRFGMIGRCWRTRQPFSIGRLLPDAERPSTEMEIRKAIASSWGMTQAEAQHSMERPSYVAIPLDTGIRTVGIFFMDSTAEDGFKPNEVAKFAADRVPVPVNPGLAGQPGTDMLLPILIDGLKAKGIVDAIEKLDEQFKEKATRVNFERLTSR